MAQASAICLAPRAPSQNKLSGLPGSRSGRLVPGVHRSRVPSSIPLHTGPGRVYLPAHFPVPAASTPPSLPRVSDAGPTDSADTHVHTPAYSSAPLCPVTTPLPFSACQHRLRTAHGPRRESSHGSQRRGAHNTCQKEPQPSHQAKVPSQKVPLTVGPRSVPTSSHMGAWRGPTIFNEANIRRRNRGPWAQWAGGLLKDQGAKATFWPIHPAGVRNIARALGYRLVLPSQFGSRRAMASCGYPGWL